MHAVRPTFDILVVDDNASNLLAIEAALAGLGLNLVTAQSGADALRWLLERDFALILLDIEMPGMDGFETARLIRGRLRTRHVPIIFVTAFSRDDREILEGYALGAVDFLFKPIVPEILRAKASVFVELRRRTDEVARQAELLREAERQDHARRLAEERQRWEAEALREQMEKEKAQRRGHGAEGGRAGPHGGPLERVEAELTERTAASWRRRTGARTSSSPCSATSCATRWRRSSPASSSCARARVDDPILRKRACGALDRQVAHLTRLVDDLLDVSRITTGKIELRREPLSRSATCSTARWR